MPGATVRIGIDLEAVNKLDDEQIRRFICDGVLILDSGVPAAVNREIFEKIQSNNTREFNMGNNVLPRVPELQQVLDAPTIRGALQSVLGNDYLPHPHRFMHASEPLDEGLRDIVIKGDEHGPAMGKGSSGSSHWHQDAQSPLSRARYHVPRLAMVLYFPQDTPIERGPTRVIPGTHLHARLHQDDFPDAFVPPEIKAGSCLLIAFDVGHAALSNRTDMSRYMFKFVFMRTRNPTLPSWDGGSDSWKAPEGAMSKFAHPDAWSYIWDWMRGHTHASSHGTSSPDEIAELIQRLNSADQERRLDAVYTLAGIDEAIKPLCDSLLTHAGMQREYAIDYREPDPSIQYREHHERGWNEDAYVLQDEAYALGAAGEDAIESLTDLLQHSDDWIKINAAFALGEIGAAASGAIEQLAGLLNNEKHQVARAALDAMACIGCNIEVALPSLRRLLTTNNPDWQKELQRGWTGENQARFNALCVLLSSDIDASDIEDLLVDCLDDANGYVHALAIEALTRLDQGKGLQHALAYLKTHRFDATLAHGKRVY